MAPLTLEVRHNSEGTIECWDDDDELQFNDDINLRATSTATSVTNSSLRRSGHRDSISSRRSARSDLDSTAGGDEDWQVQLLDDDEIVNEEALTSAKNAGIPLPTNVPRSALIGGTIKRLGRRKTKREFIDDWSDDLELPGPDAVLELKRSHDTPFPDSLPQLSSTAASPVKTSPFRFGDDGDLHAHQGTSQSILDNFLDLDDIDDSQDVPTIKIANPQPPQRASIIGYVGPSEEASAENFEDDFELPADNLLSLCRREPPVRDSSPTPEDFDVEWSEGSIGVRFGGTTRDHRSNPSSSISVVSPSASSYLTGESDDEGLDGLVIPEGPLDFGACLKRRKNPNSTDAARLQPDHEKCEQPPPADDFFSGLEINENESFNTRRPSVNPNIRCKSEPLGSPARRSATTLTFTNGPLSPKTRIPRLSGHDRPHSTHLETVSESGAPLSKFRTSPRRSGGHVAHSSVSSLPASGSTSISPTPPFTPSRRLVGTRIAKELLGERAAPGRQLLRSKRSMPSMRNHSQITSTTSLPSPHRPDGSTWSNPRLWTPIDRTASDVRLSGRKSAPFIPAGASDKQSHHASVKTYRYSRRTSSDGTSDTVSSQGSITRISRPNRYDNNSNEATQETLNTTPKRTLTRPTRRRNFGDGTELASFDDLPTSSAAESKYVKQPCGRGAPRALRHKLGLSQSSIQLKPESPTPQAPTSSTPFQQGSIPRFARDTNASRNAREQRIASMSSSSKSSRESNALAPLNSNWKTQTISRMPSSTVSVRTKRTKSGTISGSRPQLIKPIGVGVQEAKSINGMQYNPASYRWEGNENMVHGFDTTSPKSPKSSPALITNFGAMQNVQVVGGMVFDPQRMCWLKLAPSQPGVDGLVAVQDEDDVFSNFVDLKENSGISGRRGPGVLDDLCPAASGDDRSCEDSSDEWPITEEFDVGPEFIRRQHTEEEKWRRKVDKWVNHNHNHNHAGFGSSWRWAIRDLVRINSSLGAQGLNNP
ncbi:hypothetical protein P175DRAFT_0436745 [Aspergillus ochraceoroseus IBT 24754]|nr:uncharacterized protein P175DRAFT_0436745 [Aspergillus ochraceoroseus IBT 24754]PTU20956.1 hypothetical protein P175DRAFT_0436745 [Aspergillus ochraceoroseus IBT 24754]